MASIFHHMRELASTPASQDPDLIRKACEVLPQALSDRGSLWSFLAAAPRTSALWAPEAIGTVLGEAGLREPLHVYHLTDPVLTGPLISEALRAEVKSLRNSFDSTIGRLQLASRLCCERLQHMRYLSNPQHIWMSIVKREIRCRIWAAYEHPPEGSHHWANMILDNVGLAKWQEPSGRIHMQVIGERHWLLSVSFQDGWEVAVHPSVDPHNPPREIVRADQASRHLFAELLFAYGQPTGEPAPVTTLLALTLLEDSSSGSSV